MINHGIKWLRLQVKLQEDSSVFRSSSWKEGLISSGSKVMSQSNNQPAALSVWVTASNIGCRCVHGSGFYSQRSVRGSEGEVLPLWCTRWGTSGVRCWSSRGRLFRGVSCFFTVTSTLHISGGGGWSSSQRGAPKRLALLPCPTHRLIFSWALPKNSDCFLQLLQTMSDCSEAWTPFGFVSWQDGRPHSVLILSSTEKSLNSHSWPHRLVFPMSLWS